MENLNRAFTHVNTVFSSTNHLFDRKITANPDVPPTEIVHVSNLDDVQSFLLAPMEATETNSVLQSGLLPHPNLYVAPMTEELSGQVNEAIANSWRVDLYNDAAPTAPDEFGLTLGLTQQESTWLKKLMKGPIVRSRARAVEDAAYVKGIDDSFVHSREYDRQLLEVLTPEQFDQEVDAFCGSENTTDKQDAEMEVHARDDADEICLIDTSGNSPEKRMQTNGLDCNGPTSPFGFDGEQHLSANPRHEDDMNADGVFELGQDSGVENNKCCSGHEATIQTTPAEVTSRPAPHNGFDLCDEEPEYEPPESFECLSPPRQDHTFGPFTIDDIGTFPHTAPEAQMSTYQTNHSDSWQGGFTPAMLSRQDSEQPMDLVPTEASYIGNTEDFADLQLEAELHASSNQYNTASPGPYTRLLKATGNYATPPAQDAHCPEMRIQEPAFCEPTFVSTRMTDPPILPSNRTPSPLRRTQPFTPAPHPPTTIRFTTPTLLPILLPKPLLTHPAISTPPTPTPKSVKAVFASPNLRSGPPSPCKSNNNTNTNTTNTNNVDRETPSRISADYRICGAELAHRTAVTDTDFAADDDEGEGDTVRVHMPALGRGLGVGLGLDLQSGHLQMQMQTQPDSAIDVSFPAAEAKSVALAASGAGAGVVEKPSGKTKTKTKGTTDATTKAPTTDRKKKVGRPRRGESVMAEGSVRGLLRGGDTDGEKGVGKALARKRVRKGARGAVGGGVS